MKSRKEIVLDVFPASLWSGEAGLPRLALASPLYAERYRGIRPPSELGAHRHWELTCVLDGELELLVESGGSLHMERGSVILIPKGFAHTELSKFPVDTIWIGVEMPDAPPCIARDRCLALESAEIQDMVERLWTLSRRGGAVGTELDGMLLCILGRIMRTSSEGIEKDGLGVAEKAARMFEERFSEDLQMPSVARSLGVSEGHFYRVFKEAYKRTPVEYLCETRMKEAAQLLSRTEMPVKDVASNCGYRDQFYFSRLFTRRFGHSPSSYREVSR